MLQHRVARMPGVGVAGHERARKIFIRVQYRAVQTAGIFPASTRFIGLLTQAGTLDRFANRLRHCVAPSDTPEPGGNGGEKIAKVIGQKAVDARKRGTMTDQEIGRAKLIRQKRIKPDGAFLSASRNFSMTHTGNG